MELSSESDTASMESPVAVVVLEATRNMFHAHHAASGASGEFGALAPKHVATPITLVSLLVPELASMEFVHKAKPT